MPQIPVQDLMNRQVPTVLENASINEAAIALLEHDAAEVYVVNRGGVLRGVIPEYEILKARLCGVSRDASIESLVTHSLQTLSPNASAVGVAMLFREGFRSAMAVVDSHGRLIGQIKRRELIWLLTTLDRLEDPIEPQSPHNSQVPIPADSNQNRDRETQRKDVPAPNFLRRRRVLGSQISDSLRE